jgi:iron complex transport system permease protein
LVFSRNASIFLLLTILLLVFMWVSLLTGSVTIPFMQAWDALWAPAQNTYVTRIIHDLRLPRTLAALLAGSALALSGLLLQTVFRNPLAGPFVLGISSGASLGVALVLLGSNILGISILGGGMVAGGFAGAGASLFLLLLFSKMMPGSIGLLVFGLMFGYLSGALVSILVAFSDAQSLQLYMFWSLGSFSRIGGMQLLYLAIILASGIVLSLLSVKYLNAILLGESNAQSLGIHTGVFQKVVLLSSGLLTAGVTAYCGPVAFIGLAVPHLARWIFLTSHHKVLIPACLLLGASLALLAGIVAEMPWSNGTLPLNAVMALIGAPVVIWVIVRRAR